MTTTTTTQTRTQDGSYWLVDSETTSRVRLATQEEIDESFSAGPEGHIRVDGRRVYVEETMATATKTSEGFYGNDSDTYFVTATGSVWHVQSVDGGPAVQVDALPEGARKLPDQSCHDIDLSAVVGA